MKTPSASMNKVSEKKPRGYPKGLQRVHLQLWEKIKTVQHYVANPKMTHPEMIAWCFSTFKMPKRLSACAMSKLLKSDSVVHYLQLAQTKTNPHVLNTKRSEGRPDGTSSMSGLVQEMEGSLEQATCLSHALECFSNPTHLPHRHFSKVAGENGENLSDKIQSGINRRDDEFLRVFFQNKTASSGTSVLTNQQFTFALEELGINLQEEEIKVLFRMMDVNNDGGMDLDEFKRAVRFPSQIEQLIGTLPIPQVFSDAITEAIGMNSLRQFGQLTPKQIEDVCLAAMPFVTNIIRDAVAKINESFSEKDKSKDCQGARKFEVPPEMSAGTVADFHGGLAERIGNHFILRRPTFCSVLLYTL
jgi:hypothetical protein